MTMQMTCVSENGRELLQISREMGATEWCAVWSCLDGGSDQSVTVSIDLEEILNVLEFVYNNTTTTVSMRFKGADASLFVCVQHLMLQYAPYMPQLRKLMSLFDLRSSGFSSDVHSEDAQVSGTLISDEPHEETWVTISRSGLDVNEVYAKPAPVILEPSSSPVRYRNPYYAQPKPKAQARAQDPEPDLSGKFVMDAPSTIQ